MIHSVLDRLTHLHPKVIDLSLERVERLLAALGHPQNRLPPVVHVAGTNGKGSTVATLRALCEAAGLRVHVYTSPHLVRFAERVRIAGSLPSDEALAALLREVETVNDGAPITFFEATTAAAFLAFARSPADVCILETGLGGRLDATNVVERPALTVITPIDLDHQQFLGNTLAEIAGEKAGILKPAVPCVMAAQQAEAAAVLEARAACLAAPLIRAGMDFRAGMESDGGLRFVFGDEDMLLPPPVLAGEFQVHNTGLALAAMQRLAADGVVKRPDAAALAHGIRAVEWPARLQHLRNGPLVEMLPSGWELWLDGGHNPHGAAAIARHAKQHWGDKPLLAVFALLRTKDIDGFLAPLSGRFTALRAVAIPGEAASLTAEEAAAAARRHDVADAAPAERVAAAIRELVAAQAGPARILICGSLYLAGTVLADNG